MSNFFNVLLTLFCQKSESFYPLQDSRVDSGSVDLGTPLELSPKSPLEALDEALDAVSQLRK